VNYVQCLKCGRRNTEKFGYGQWHCLDCGHFFEHWDRADQFTRNMASALDVIPEWDLEAK
jgi:ribosomal protein L37AE/L43A